MSLRKATAFTILIAWVGIVGWHVRREYFAPAAERLALGARTLAPGSYWFTVRMGEHTIGFATASLDTVPTGFELTDELILNIPTGDSVARAEARTRISLDGSLALASFDFTLGSALGVYDVSGRVFGPGALEVSVNAGSSAGEGDQPERTRMRLAEGVSLDAAVPLRLAASGSLEVGRSATATVFDPSTLSTRDIALRVTATDTLIVTDSAGIDASGRWFAAGTDTIPVWRIEQQIGGIAIATWVDEDGLTVRAETPLGFTIERTAFELARQAFRDPSAPAAGAGYGALIEATAIASNVPLDDAASFDSLSVRLLNVDLAGFDLDGGRQTLHGDTLTIVRDDYGANGTGGYSLPHRSRNEAQQGLGATALIQADDPRIQEAARAAVGRTRDPVRAAQKLNEWVYRTLRKEIAPSVPSAVQVLESGRGDCNEHTVLYVAMARSIGLPARTAVGLVHVRGKFYYHAWPEVWLWNRWVAVDPTLGQVPADASHIRLLIGGLARQIELVPLLGRLDIEILPGMTDG